MKYVPYKNSLKSQRGLIEHTESHIWLTKSVLILVN